MKKDYATPRISSEKSFETSALACAKYPDTEPPGSWHMSSAYDTFTGHMGSGFGGSESVSGSAGIGFGPGGTTQSYAFIGMCGTWISYAC
jgi:hypothetical protein